MQNGVALGSAGTVTIDSYGSLHIQNSITVPGGEQIALNGGYLFVDSGSNVWTGNMTVNYAGGGQNWVNLSTGTSLIVNEPQWDRLASGAGPCHQWHLGPQRQRVYWRD